MTARAFVDTNVLVYARDARSGEKQRRASRWLTDLWETENGRLSVQVLNEFYHTVTARLDPGMDREAARRDVRSLLAWKPVTLDPPLMEEGWKLQDRYRLSFWDALIVAAARSASCEVLLTEDLQDGQNLDGLLVVNPFLHEPG